MRLDLRQIGGSRSLGRSLVTQPDRAAAELTGIGRRCCPHADRYPGEARLCMPGRGGELDGALIVRVSARAVDGKTTEAALTAVADSFGVSHSAVRLAAGASSSTKIVDIDAGDPCLLASLLAPSGPSTK
jgi:uncharacterized protein